MLGVGVPDDLYSSGYSRRFAFSELYSEAYLVQFRNSCIISFLLLSFAIMCSGQIGWADQHDDSNS